MKAYCPEPLAHVPVHPLFYFKYQPGERPRGLFKENLPPNYFEHDVAYVGAATKAEVIVLPNNFTSFDSAAEAYVAGHADEAERLGIPLFLFSFGDFTDRLHFDPRAYIFRLSIYRSALGPRDISVSTLTEDLGQAGIHVRSRGSVPRVSFCGQAGYQTFKQWIKYYLKVLAYTGRPARRLGVYWRRRMMQACRNSKWVTTTFIIRRSFSGAQRTIELDPVLARQEFVDSIIGADFVLAPKGDGNYSNRFLEALSLGRIPVYVDTDMVLPLEEIIDYTKIAVRVPMHQVVQTPQYIKKFYDALTEGEWRERQELARTTFATYLRHDSFFATYFQSFGLPPSIPHNKKPLKDDGSARNDVKAY